VIILIIVGGDWFVYYLEFLACSMSFLIGMSVNYVRVPKFKNIAPGVVPVVDCDEDKDLEVVCEQVSASSDSRVLLTINSFPACGEPPNLVTKYYYETLGIFINPNIKEKESVVEEPEPIPVSKVDNRGVFFRAYSNHKDNGGKMSRKEFATAWKRGDFK
jgi:hypothetical protein